MKNIVTIALILVSTVFFAQSPITTTVGKFKELKVYDLIDVNLVPSNEDKIIISGKNTDKVVFVNKNGVLKIKMSIDALYNGDDTTVTLHYTGVDILDVNEGASISSNDTIKQFEINLNAQEGGTIEVSLDVSYTNVKSISGGNIKASGVSKNQNISIKTGGVYNGKELKTETTDVTVTAAGEARIHASGLVTAKVTAGGNVYIYGNPKSVDESKVMGGNIKRMD
ncbi:head GIN domain-containing protein [Xanthomarina spongicola]|jgi:hypothetical protein|uniref:Putative autotransporter adhesin-like protein n=1 Tax=Xanthomarina spongicola TaxID=570520 RepID=A0A316DTM1_9FLAO|nr:head GIN domain-containing protein [Xanthomarina spongicola]PWK20539.1 putative autotransporter adhesin-like protein [Xanthomarina spongicola]